MILDGYHKGTAYVAEMLEDGVIETDGEHIWAEQYPTWDLFIAITADNTERFEIKAKVNAQWYSIERELYSTFPDK